MAYEPRQPRAPLSRVMLPKRGPADAVPRDRDPSFLWVTSSEPHKDLVATCRRLILHQQRRLWDNMRAMSLYANENYLQPYTAGGTYLGTTNQPSSARSSMPYQTENRIRVNTDTLAGKLVQSNSRVSAATVDGDWRTFKVARKIGHVLDATWMDGYLWRECSRVAVDAINTGTGYLWVGEDYVYSGAETKPRVRFERWYPNEIFFDPLDSAYGEPQLMFRMRYMKRENAMAYWGSDAHNREVIDNATTASAPTFAWAPFQHGMIEVFEGWCLPGPRRKGRHVMCMSSGTLNLPDEQEWPYERFPVAIFKAGQLPLGVYGSGFVRNAGPAQIELNRMLNVVARSANLGVAPYWVVAGGAEIIMKHLVNQEGHVVTSNGPEPKWVTNQPFHPAAVEYIDMLRKSVDIVYGVSEIESQGAMPLDRLDSNPALIQVQDMWMARHTILLKNYSEDFFMDVAERTLDAARCIVDRLGSYPVIVESGDRSWGMDWKDFAALDRASYKLKLATENALPLTPAARKREVMLMQQQAMISNEKALQLMTGDPDLDAVTAEVAAFENNAEYLIEELYEGRTPDMLELQRPELVLARVRAAGLVAQTNGAPDDVLAGFEEFAATLAARIDQNDKLNAALAAAQAGVSNGSSSNGVQQPSSAVPGVTVPAAA